MARSIGKIDSKTQSVGEFLRLPLSYKVPVYQRDFAWTSEKVDILWDDLKNALENDRESYFLGAIVLSHTSSDNSLDIVDGQQRIIVISMILATIRDEWKKENDDERAQDVSRDYLGKKDRRSGDITPKITLNETNDIVYQDNILNRKEISTIELRQLPSTNKLLFEAHKNIEKKLSEWLSSQEDTESALIELEKYIDEKTNFIVIEVADDSDAFIIFETLNDRGLVLAVSDLVKNYLFSKAADKITRFKLMWNEITTLIGGSDNMTQFLRHFWLSEYDLVRERDLYRTLRSEINTHIKARKFLERLKKVASFYSALINPDHGFWVGFTNEARYYIETLRLFKVTQFRPVALAIMEDNKPELVTKVFKMLMIISFRYTVISTLGTGNLEKIYSDTAIAIRKKNINTPTKIFNKLKKAYIDDDRFTTDFKQKKFTKSNISRYILAKINDCIEGNLERSTNESNQNTLEHILPKRPNKSKWPNVIPKGEEYSTYNDLIGNLTLLEKSRNKGIGNSSFIEKRDKAYKKSTLSLNKDISSKRAWTHIEIKERSSLLADKAKDIWVLKY